MYSLIMYVDRCCGIRCSAFTYGQFVAFVGPGDDPEVEAYYQLCSALECAPASDYDTVEPWMGSVDIWGVLDTSVVYSNFSYCCLHPEYGGTGTAIDLDHGGDAALAYLNVVNCSGNAAIDNRDWVDSPMLWRANFYDNVLPNSEYSLIQSASFGFQVQECTFRGNRGQLFGISDAPEIPFRVWDCVFSDSFPPSSEVVFLGGTGNRENTETASYDFPQLGTCPPVPFVPLPSISTTPDATRSPTPTFWPTVEFNVTGRIAPSDWMNASGNVIETIFVLSSPVIQSEADEASSHFFDASEPFLDGSKLVFDASEKVSSTVSLTAQETSRDTGELAAGGSPRGTVLIGVTIGTVLGLILLAGLIFLLFLRKREESSAPDPLDPDPDVSVTEIPFDEALMVHDYDNPLLGLDSSSSAFSKEMDELFTNAPNDDEAF
jgi:hypothetical protein